MRHLLRCERAYHFARHAHHETPIRDLPAFRDQRAGADQTMRANLGTVQNHRVDTNQTVVADRAAVQHGLVPHRDVVPDSQWITWIGVQYREILNIRVFTHRDRFTIAAYHGPEPDAGIVLEQH